MIDTIKQAIHEMFAEPKLDLRQRRSSREVVPGELPTELLAEFGYVPVAGRHTLPRNLRRLDASDITPNGWSAN